MGELHKKEKELIKSVNLCDAAGQLLKRSIGWSRTPLVRCNLRGHNFRKKKWNYWLFISDDCLFSATISNLDYIGMVFVYFYDYKTREFIEKTVSVPFGKGCIMPEGVNETVIFNSKKMNVSFIKENMDTRIIINSENFGNKNLHAELLVERSAKIQSLNVVIPWERNRFQFTSKQNCLPVDGKVSLDDKTYVFHKENNFASLDFGRGIWPYKTMWNWATCSGIYNNKVIGFNLGAKWTDGTGMTENGVMVSGIINKIGENIIFDYDPKDLMQPWNIKTEFSDRIDVKFYPIYNRTAATNAILIKSKVHQIIGEFTGTITSPSGKKIYFERLKGSSEEHFARW